MSHTQGNLGTCKLAFKPLRMSHPPTATTWPARFQAHQVSIHESDLHQIWISSIEVRKVVPRLRADTVLLNEYPADFMKLDRGPRHFFNERALRTELKRVRSQEALMFLAWLEKTVYYPAARRRGSTPALKPMPSKNVAGQEDTEEDLHVPRIKPVPAHRAERSVPVASETTSGGVLATMVTRPLFRLWRGQEGLMRTLVGGALAMVGWSIVIVMMISVVTDPATYDGSYKLRQWAVLLLLLFLTPGGIWWGVGLMRCAMRRHHEGHGFFASLASFAGAALMTLQLLAFNLGLAAEWVDGWWDTVTNHLAVAEVIHDPVLGRIVLRGEIGFGSYEALDRALQLKPRLTLLQVEGPGGFVFEGLALARLIERHKLDTVSFEDCASACTLLLAAGQERYLGAKARVGFHRSGRSNFNVSKFWTSTDHELADYYRSRDTTDDFIREALDTPFDNIWEPDHGRMFSSGYATKRWDERKSRY